MYSPRRPAQQRGVRVTAKILSAKKRLNERPQRSSKAFGCRRAFLVEAELRPIGLEELDVVTARELHPHAEAPSTAKHVIDSRQRARRQRQQRTLMLMLLFEGFTWHRQARRSGRSRRT